MRVKKLFIVRKYIMALDIRDAIRLDKTAKPDDIWMDEDWRKSSLSEPPEPNHSIGFKQKDGAQTN